jgi:single-stranded-DNA-specific exonuclease
MTRWMDAPAVDPISLAKLTSPDLIKQVLIRRGITTVADAEAFLNPTRYPSTIFPDIESAVDPILASIEKDEPICVWGDFDVDGQTSTTLLVETLQSLGANVTHYIPIRGKEGHGLHIETLKPILSRGAKLILTCDTGITANAAVEYIIGHGAKVIITDHHDPANPLPNATAIINPKLLDPDHRLANLAGVGVGYKLAEALLESKPDINPDQLKDLAAMGLVADVALLKAETRAIVQAGIHKLRSTSRLGLITMAELAGVDLSNSNEQTIGFTLAPRLNALGRLSDANPAVDLLMTKNPARARVLATQIEGLNAQRKLLTDQVYEAAEIMIGSDPKLLSQPILLLHHTDWPGGVLGIVASKLVERYQKPAIVMSLTADGELRGSARSIEGLHITQAIAECRELLLAYGGHPMAAGLSLKAGKFPDFQRTLNKAVESQLKTVTFEEAGINIEAWLDLNSLTLDLGDTLEVLAPFGPGNPSPVFATHNLRMKSHSLMGKNKEHRKLTVSDQNDLIREVIWWDGASEALPEGKFDLAFSLRSTSFRTERKLSLEYKAFRTIEAKPVAIVKPTFVIMDMRRETAKFEEIRKSRIVWAEGNDKAIGLTRLELTNAQELVIWTTPASAEDLHEVLRMVSPQKIYIFGVSPQAITPEEFLTKLAGLAKYVINQKSSQVSLKELAVEMSQRASAIRLGLAWLSAGGHVLTAEQDDQIILKAGNGMAEPYLQKEIYLAVKGVIEETHAYRLHFQTAPIDSLFTQGRSVI